MKSDSIASNITVVSKEIDGFPESPMETIVTVGGYPFNSLVEHPYKESFSGLSVPAGLVVSQETREYEGGMTRELVHGGGAKVPDVIKDELYDALFDKISVKKVKRLTRKKRV